MAKFKYVDSKAGISVVGQGKAATQQAAASAYEKKLAEAKRKDADRQSAKALAVRNKKIKKAARRKVDPDYVPTVQKRRTKKK